MDTEPAASQPLTRADVLRIVQEKLADELQIEPGKVRTDDRLDLLPNADSLRLMRVVARLEKEFQVEFDDDRIRTADTVAELADLAYVALRQLEPRW